jgi:glycosyltransferase involved in cell wall biosynthesis
MEAGFLTRSEARKKLSLPLDATVIANVARIDEGKGTHELLEAALQAMAHHADLHLMLIGPPTADDPKAVAFGKAILARIENLAPDLRARVHAPGAVPESYRYLKAFDLFALPTYCECFALSLLEAQLAGVPCLATSTGGSPEVVHENQTGWLFAPRSIDACYEAIERALKNRDQWVPYGTCAQTRIRSDFDFHNILPKLVQHYQALIK